MTSTTTTTAGSRPAVHPNKLRFVEGVNLVFDSWTALTLAVQMEFAGEDTLEKAAWLRQVIVEHFDAGKLHTYRKYLDLFHPFYFRG